MAKFKVGDHVEDNEGDRSYVVEVTDERVFTSPWSVKDEEFRWSYRSDELSHVEEET
jgi:hypothetical protein